MKFKINVEAEATEEELKQFAADVLRRQVVSFVGDVGRSLGRAFDSPETLNVIGLMNSAWGEMLRSAAAQRAGAEECQGCQECGQPVGGVAAGSRKPGDTPSPIPQPAGTPPAPQIAVEPEVLKPPYVCGQKLRDDTMTGDPWAPCNAPVEFAIKHPGFGNRGRIARLCCLKHHTHMTGADPTGFHTTRVAGPFPSTSLPKEDGEE